MDQRSIPMLFALLRSAVFGTKLSEEEREAVTREEISSLLHLAEQHDLAHLLVLGLKQNGLLTKEDAKLETELMKALYRYERSRVDFEALCATLEEAEIPFLPLKGSVLRDFYPEPWMRTSCDLDVLVHREDLEKAIENLTKSLGYAEKERDTHDVSLFTPKGIHIELHFDLVEEGRANNAITILRSVWESATLRENSHYHYEMTDAFFYFYHIAHMAKHFEVGGCGIRPFLDLWILDHREAVDSSARDEILAQGGLLTFAKEARKLSRFWFGGEEASDFTLQMQEFLLLGGCFGTSSNRVALQQKKKGGKFGYLFSRIFISYDKLKRYYPILEKHRWLMPVMQVRRWLMLFQPQVALRTKREIETNLSLDKESADQMGDFLGTLGL